MKVVLDTNVLISGVFFSGLPARILAAWADGRFELVVTVEVLAEYRRVAERLHKRFPAIDIKPILDLVIRETSIVGPRPFRHPPATTPTISNFWGARLQVVRAASSPGTGRSCGPLVFRESRL